MFNGCCGAYYGCRWPKSKKYRQVYPAYILESLIYSVVNQRSGYNSKGTFDGHPVFSEHPRTVLKYAVCRISSLLKYFRCVSTTMLVY